MTKGENIQWRKDSLFNKWCWENWTATCKRMKLEHSPMLHTKISYILSEVNPRVEIIKEGLDDIDKNGGVIFVDKSRCRELRKFYRNTTAT